MKFKNPKGFTLIELIVVIAIIGILAAVLVPNMVGYVQSAKQTAANENAKAIYDALSLSAVKLDSQGIVMGVNGNFRLSQAGISGDAGDCVDMQQWLSGPQFSEAQRQEMRADLGGYIDIVYKGGFPESVAWSKEKDDGAIIGRYPRPLSIESGLKWNNWTT